MRVVAYLGCLVCFLAWIGSSIGQEKKEEPKPESPVVLMSIPLEMPDKGTHNLTLRGLRLEMVEVVKCLPETVQVKLTKKEKTSVPNQQDAKKVGDTLVQIELTLPEKLPDNVLHVELTLKAGELESQSYHIPLSRGIPLLQEKENNGGFKQAQLLTCPQTVLGMVQAGQDVDVFRYEGKQGEKLRWEISAARQGSGLDAVLNVYASAGQVLAVSDDQEGLDPAVAVTLPTDGDYFISVMDAHDRGGPAHPYRLLLRKQ